MNYYRRFMGDYLRDTAGLSLAEHGAYTVLLDTYYATMRPLPASLDALYRLCRAMTKPEQLAVALVAETYFPIAADGLRHNKRADEEIAKAIPAMEKQSEAGRRGAARRWGKPTPDASLSDGEPDGVPHKVPDPVPQPPTHRVAMHPPSSIQKTRSKDLSVPDDFARFWAAYPRKDAKAKALPAFRRQKAGAVLDRILADIASRRQEWADPQFIPMPATYLNARRWEDEREHLATGEAFGGGGL